VPLLLDAVVEGQGLKIRFDALELQALRGAGTACYAPVLFHETEKPGREQKALLELLGLLLSAAQGQQPDWGLLFHGSGYRVRRVKLGSGLSHARRTLSALQELRETGIAPRLTLNAHCQLCEFRTRCRAEAAAKDDLSLLRGLSEKEIVKYSRRGIFTVTQLAYLFRPRKKSKRSKHHGQRRHHTLQALAIRDRKIYVLGTPELPDCPIRAYLDVEGDPERGFDYLLGLTVEADGILARHRFWADTPAEEPWLLRQLVVALRPYANYRIYCYGSYEADFLRRVAKAAGEPDLAAHLLPRLVNVVSVIRPHVYFPTYSNGLKDVAGYLGCRWSEPDASGIQSIVWRRRWEQTGAATLRERLTIYNQEDCDALRAVTRCLLAICQRPAGPEVSWSQDGHEVSRAEEARMETMSGWADGVYGVPDFGVICTRAYFDYQQEHVYIRTGRLQYSRPRKCTKRWRRDRPVNEEVEIVSSTCPTCEGTNLTRKPNRSLFRLAFDLRVGRRGVRSWTIRYRAARHVCGCCGSRFLPADYLRLQEFCQGLKGWAMYEYVAHRVSMPSLAEALRECYDLPIHSSQVVAFKEALGHYYQATWQRLLADITAGHLVHVDETEVDVRGVGRGYVWVFTNLKQVVYLYRPSREAEFLHGLLTGFKGVLVSDFYGGYDSLPCPQQRCLIHLLRDFNHDILAGPWDEELKAIAGEFGTLLRLVVATVDRYGLRRRHLAKHRRDVDRFYRSLAARAVRSEKAEGYQVRLQKERDRLFTFLDYDDVPWNNNNAEHAIKAFAHYRKVNDGLCTESGLKHYLVLLSIQQTCRNQGVSFLRFLVSGQTDVGSFCSSGGKRVVPAIELYPEDQGSPRPSRGRVTSQTTGRPSQAPQQAQRE
jgi:predicted RecB family nuclease